MTRSASPRSTSRTPKSGGQKEIRSLSKGLDILFLFQPGRPALSVEDISRELGLPKSSTYRLVATLRKRGFLRKLAGTDSYTLDARLLRFGEIVRASTDLHRVALPHMEELAERTRETVVLVLRSGDRGVVVEKAESAEMTRFIPSVGWSFPLQCGSTGKVLLADLPEDKLEKYLARPLERVTEKTIVDPDELLVELQRVKKAGYAISDEEFVVGTRAVAAPIRDDRGSVVAGLAIAGPAERLSLERIRELVPCVLECAEAISAELGAFGAPELATAGPPR